MASSEKKDIWKEIRKIYNDQNKELKKLDFLSNRIRFVYNPTEYASEPWEKYLRTYCNNKKKVLFVGINPGPWGMCQTGIPFGTIEVVRDYLKIGGHVGQPANVCEKRSVDGFQCTKTEESGKRFWKLIRDEFHCVEPEDFFGKCFLYNYCPLAFMREKGGGIVPRKLKRNLKNALERICDETLRDIIRLLKPKIVVGIGRYPEGRANFLKNRGVFNEHNIDVTVLYMRHPSPSARLSEKQWLENAKTMINEKNLNKILSKRKKLNNIQKKSN